MMRIPRVAWEEDISVSKVLKAAGSGGMICAGALRTVKILEKSGIWY